MGNRIITISRKFGSGGHFIGEQVAKKLGLPFFDKQILDKIAEETGFAKDFIKEHSEYSDSGSIFSYAFVGRDASGSSLSDQIYNVQSKIIRDLAEKESFVIIGRCADYILKDFDNVTDIFITADEKSRSERIEKLYKKTPNEAVKMIREMDKKRKLHYEYYTDQIWGDCANYNMTLNSGKIGRDKCIEIIAGL